MLARPNELQWQGSPGHYEVYYVSFTDTRSGVGVWLRYTLLAPTPAAGEPATCSLWLLAVDPRPGEPRRLGRKVTFPIAELEARNEPFVLRINGASLSDHGATGCFDDVEWELRWRGTGHPYEHVHPLLRRTGTAETVLVLPHADLSIEGNVRLADWNLELSAARGAQAHLWGAKHARRWAWAHCNDFKDADGHPVRDTFVDAVSVIVSRLRRELGPSTPVVGRIAGHDFCSTSPLRVLANDSTFTLTGWRFEAVDRDRKLVAEVDAERDALIGVTYTDPDGELAYCYNAEIATMRLHVFEKAKRVGGWSHVQTLVGARTTHFEYAQRTAVPELELLTR